MLSADNLPEDQPRPRRDPLDTEFPTEGLDLDAAVADLERALIQAALKQSGGVRKKAAKLLNISFRSLRYRLDKLGIEVGRAES